MKRSKTIVSALLAVAVASIAMLSGCSGGKSSGTAKPSTFNVGLSGDIISLDPAFAYDSNTIQVVDQVTEGLLAYSNDNKLVCRLAKSWKCVNPTTYVYEVKDNIKFSDGTPMTMDDVLFSLNRTKDAATASNEGWMYANVASITKTGDWELTVKLSKPDATWQYVFATTGGHIISKKYYEEHKDSFGKPEGGVLGTGPYKFVKWVSGNEIDLEKNTNYWDDPSKIEINKVIYKVITESSTMLSAVKTGQVDAIFFVSQDSIAQYKALTNVNTVLNDGYVATDLCFNCQRAPFDDANVRRAIASAVDANSINNSIAKFAVKAGALPFGLPVASYETDSWKSFNETAPYIKYDMTKAKEYLKQSKYPNGFDCNIIVNATETTNNSICLALQQSLKELNINLNIKKVQYNDFISYAYGSKVDKNGKRDYDMLIWNWLSDWPDPAGYMIPLYSSANIGQGGSNWSAYVNKDVDKLLDEQNQSLDPKERTKLLQQAITISNNEAAYSVINYPKDTFVVNKKFTYTPSASWFYNMFFKDIKVN